MARKLIVLLAIGLCLSETVIAAYAESYVWSANHQTLTLNNAALTEPIMLENDATIVLSGSNTIKIDAKQDSSVYAIDSNSKLKLTGEGDLSIEVTNANGNAGGIAAAALTIDLSGGSHLSIAAKSKGQSGRGIFSENGCDMNSGTLTVNASSGGTEADAFAVFTNNGNVNIGKSASADFTLISTSGSICGIQANGNFSLGGKLVLIGQSKLGATGIQAFKQLVISDGSVKAKLTSSGGNAIGLESYSESVKITGDVDCKLKGLATVGGIWAPKTIETEKANIEISATSTSNKGNDSGAVSVHDGQEETRDDSVYGVSSDLGVTLKNSSVKISVVSNGIQAFGISSGNMIKAVKSTLDISASAAANNSYGIYSYAYSINGKQSKPAMRLSGCTANVKAGTAAIASGGDLLLEKMQGKNGEKAMIIDDLNVVCMDNNLARAVELEAK